MIYFYFILIPKQFYKLYANAKIMSQPERIEYSDKVFDDFNINCDFKKCEEINIFMGGVSINDMSHNDSLTTFIVNPNDDVELNSNYIYVTCDGGVYKRLASKNIPILFISIGIKIKNKLSFRYFSPKKSNFHLYKNSKNYSLINYFLENYQKINIVHKSQTKNLQLGSSIPCVFVLSKIAKKINIYGWDIYLNTMPKKTKNIFYNVSKLFSKSGTYRYDIYSNFAMGILNSYYAYRLNQNNNIFINGYISYFFDKKSILNKISKIIYK